jgi:hypothetical protein
MDPPGQTLNENPPNPTSHSPTHPTIDHNTSIHPPSYPPIDNPPPSDNPPDPTSDNPTSQPPPSDDPPEPTRQRPTSVNPNTVIEIPTVVRRCCSVDLLRLSGINQRRNFFSVDEMEIKKRPKSVIEKSKNYLMVIAPYIKDKEKPNKVDEAARILRYRKNVIEELLSTEQTYVTVLNTVYQIVILGINDNQKKPVITVDKQKRLFLNWQSILNCHEKILEEMMDTDSLLDLAQHVGSILMGSRKNTFLELYRYYINNFDYAHNEFVNLKNTSSAFTKFLSEIEEKLAAVKIAGSGLTLEGFLIMPVQRIPRYVMLIDSLIKFSSPQDIGYNDLVRAHEQFQSIATLINESKRKVEQLEGVKKICAQIYGFPLPSLLSCPDVRLINSV